MSTIKSLILGSAAVIAASAGAQAADLPVKAKAVQYVKICSLYGAGFYYIPGTDTCIKLGGYVQADWNINAGNYNKPAWDEAGTGANGTESRDSNYFTTRARVQLNIDTRTATEYGVVRTFWSSNFEHSTGFGPSSGNLTMDYGFIQFAGFTLGKAVSGFQTPWGAYGANQNTSFTLGGYDNATGINQIAYTWQFGNGVSAQVGIEDNRTINRSVLINASPAGTNANLFTGVYANSYGGNRSPDFVGNIRVDQAAFTAQLSGGVHNIHGTYYGANETTGAPQDEWGFAIAGGLQLKNLPTGPGDKLSLDATYVDGALKYLISGVTGNSFDHFSGGSGGFYNNFAALALSDGVFTTNSSIQKTTGWGIRGAYVHNWTPNWETGVFGSYTAVNYGGTATTALCNQKLANAGAVFGGGFAAGCNPDFNIWQVGTRTAWTPVRNLTFSGEVLYTQLDQKDVGFVTVAANPVGFKPPGTYDFKDQGIWSGNLRVRRTW
ncbi:porin [Afipia massiliensis]|uniref:Porin n=1 Tax=Afipia massiliensis TaxID=211460 RepID=A0A4U6BS93_9BRAD|nr:porin [Afipia massiliensis]TKT72851.1 porin [Afipia massiliensis]